jgi:formylglycine-generating enzyme required for sulfatase activity
MHIYTSYPHIGDRKTGKRTSFLRRFREGTIRILTISISCLFGSTGLGEGSQTVAPRVVPKDMVLVKGGTLSQASQDGKTNVGDLLVGIHEVSNRQWNEIVNWGSGLREDGVQIRPPLANFAQLSHRPMELDSIDLDRPANGMVNEDEIFMWCNLKSIKEGLKPVYYKVQYNTVTKAFPPTIGSYYGFMNSTDIEPTSTGRMGPYMDPTANGYRVPLSSEWDWIDNLGKKKPYYKYSGTDEFSTISTIPSSSGSYFLSKPAFTNASNKRPNQLGIYDLYGSVEELCFDTLVTGPSKKWPWSTNFYNETIYGEYGSFGRNAEYEHTQRLRKGGGFLYRSLSEFDRPTYSYGPERYDSVKRAFVRHDAGISGRDYNTWGFRLVRNADPKVSISRPKLPSIPLSPNQDSKVVGSVKVEVYPTTSGTNNLTPLAVPSHIGAFGDIVWVGHGQTYIVVKRRNGEVHAWSLHQGWSTPAFEEQYADTTVVTTGVSGFQGYIIAARADGSLRTSSLVESLPSMPPYYPLIPDAYTVPNPNREIVKIHSTSRYTIVLLENGTVEGWALDPNDEVIDQMLHNATAVTYNFDPQSTSLTPKTNRSPSRPKVVDISGSPDNIALLLENGGIELHPASAQIGQSLGALDNAAYDARIYPLGSTSNKVVAMDSTERHTLALFEDKSLVVKGENQHSGFAPTNIQSEVVGIDANGWNSQVQLANGDIKAWKADWAYQSSHELLLQARIGDFVHTGTYLVKLVANKEEIRRMSETAEEGLSSVKSSPNTYELWSDSDMTTLSVQRYNDGFHYGKNEVINNPAHYNLYTADSIHNLKMGGLMLQKDNLGNAQLKLKLKESSNLVNWTTKEELLWNVSLPGNKSFLRVVQDEE